MRLRLISPAKALGLAALLITLVALAGCRSGSSDSSGKSVTGPAGTEFVGWPLFGRVPERTHYLPTTKRVLDPPLHEAWSINTHGLIEFPPAISGGVAYVVNKFGNAKAVRLRDRVILWEMNTDPHNHGKPTDVTAPVYSEGKVYFAFLGGDLVAVDAATGKQDWKTNLHGHLESSPMAVAGTLYLGTDTTDVVAVDASNGKEKWRFNSPGAIKASPSFHRGRVYVADYLGAMFALEAATGKPIWRTNTTKVPPFGSGGFFSSPAIAFGHVYAARNDGTVYSFDEKTGKVAWSFPTNGFVYGSPALAKVPGTPASVYIGAENGRFFALDALSGKERWHYDVGGPIPGTATVIGNTVYTSSFKTQDTVGLDTRSHRKTFELHEAGYTPVVSDGVRLFLIGYYDLIGLEPSKR